MKLLIVLAVVLVAAPGAWLVLRPSGDSDAERARRICTQNYDEITAQLQPGLDREAAIDECVAEFEAMSDAEREVWLDAWDATD
jgi:hypothetical protein